ncbi:hypothetical protein DMP17_44275 [Pseudonocardia sp. TMWB2A]|uniref:hypothetical protein n=1 Tax=Pseudonocardia sp. TMWB2A TaxID=687430 RepID=UPI00307E56C3
MGGGEAGAAVEDDVKRRRDAFRTWKVTLDGAHVGRVTQRHLGDRDEPRFTSAHHHLDRSHGFDTLARAALWPGVQAEFSRLKWADMDVLEPAEWRRRYDGGRAEAAAL